MTIAPLGPLSSQPLTSRARIVDDCVFPIPSLAFFLNNNLIPRSNYEGRLKCSYCSRQTCGNIHLAMLPTPAPSPEQVIRPTQRIHKPRKPNRSHKPHESHESHELALPSDDDECPDRARCEVALQVTTPGCGHVFGSKCLSEKICTIGKSCCPICHTQWYVNEDPWYRKSVMRESWPNRQIMALGWNVGSFKQGS
jgi:hypothetical protein